MWAAGRPLFMPVTCSEVCPGPGVPVPAFLAAGGFLVPLRSLIYTGVCFVNSFLKDNLSKLLKFQEPLKE